MKKYIYSVVIILIFFISAKKAIATDVSCSPYGGRCPTGPQVVVDKQIKDPRTKGEVYVDNLLLSDYTFSPGEDVVFKITVKNISLDVIENVKIYDSVPSVLNYVLLSGDPRESIRELSREIGSLSAGESKTLFIRMRVKPASQLPEGTSCGDPNAINRVRVSADNMPDVFDTSSFCVQKKVLGVTKQPEAGSELLVILMGIAVFAGIGLIGDRFIAYS